MIYAFCGAQCTGKTTLINEMKKSGKFDNFEFMTGTIRDLVKEKNIEINECGNDDGQKVILEKLLSQFNFDKNKNIVFDRCILDGLAYTFYMRNHNQVGDEILQLFVKEFNDNINKFEKIFYLRPEFAMVDDGVRSLNEDFRNEVVWYFDSLLRFIDPKKLVILKGSVEQRMGKIINSIFN